MADDGSQYPRIPVRLGTGEALTDWLGELNRRVAGLSGYLLDKITGWRSTPAPDNDLVPETDDQWIGNADNPVAGVAVGAVTNDPDNPGISGVFMTRDGATDGQSGAVVMGYVAEDVREAIADPATLANAPMDIAGNIVLLSGGPVFVEVGSALTDPNGYYLLLGPSSTFPDGRVMSPLQIGPRFVPQEEEYFTDAQDFDLDIIEVTIFPAGAATFTKTFAAGDTTFAWEITLTEESSNRTSVITVELWANISGGGFALIRSDDYPMSAGSRVDVSEQFVTAGAINPGDIVELRVSAVKGHQQATPRVRGTLKPTRVGAFQG